MKQKGSVKLDPIHNNPNNEIYALLDIMKAIKIKESQLKQKD